MQNLLSLNTAKQQKIPHPQCLNLGGDYRFYELAKAENKTSVETSEVDIALSALKVSDIDARAHGLNDYEIAVARDWARLIRTKSRRGILYYKTGNQRLNLIFNNPGTKR
jgi:hypothetical protein